MPSLRRRRRQAGRVAAGAVLLAHRAGAGGGALGLAEDAETAEGGGNGASDHGDEEQATEQTHHRGNPLDGRPRRRGRGFHYGSVTDASPPGEARPPVEVPRGRYRPWQALSMQRGSRAGRF